MGETTFNRQLIHEVRIRPFLWNTNSAEYKAAKAGNRKVAWREIGAKLGKSAADCKDRWNNLRSTYRKTVTFMQKRARGEVTGRRGLTKWVHYEALQFLSNSMTENVASFSGELNGGDHTAVDNDWTMENSQQNENTNTSNGDIGGDHSVASASSTVNNQLDSQMPPGVSSNHHQFPQIVSLSTSTSQKRSTPAAPACPVHPEAQQTGPEYRLALTPQAQFLLSYEDILVNAGIEYELKIRSGINEVFQSVIAEKEAAKRARIDYAES